MNTVEVNGQNFDVIGGIVQISPEQLEDILDAAAFDAAIHDDDEMLDGEFSKKLALSDESRLKLWREYRGLTQMQLEEMSGVKQTVISFIEGGKRKGTVETFKNLAEALDVDIDDLV